MQQNREFDSDEDGFYEVYEENTGKTPRKRKRISRWVKLVAVLTVIAVVCVAVFGFGFFRKAEFAPLVDHGFATVCYAPEKNATPMNTSAIDDIAHMNYRLQQQEYWSSEMHSTVNTIVSQNVVTYKQYANGILISEDITTSSLINSAKQFCTTSDRVIWRNAAGGKGTYNGIDTPFSEGTPEGNLSLAEYKVNRGLPPSEFSVYVINENTVLDASDVTDNGDGTYSRTYRLNPALTPEDQSAVYYYKQQMYVTGGLDEHPTFSSVTVTYTYDADWRILKSEISESYTAKMIVPANCESNSVTVYDYTPEKAVNTAYEDYFKNYIDTEINPTEQTITAVKCLTGAFGNVLNEAVTFRVDIALDGQPVAGTVYVDINSMDVRVAFGNIRVYLEENGGEQTLYLAYGSGLKARFALSALDELVGEDTAFDTDLLLEQLGEGEFTVDENKTHAALRSELKLFGLTVPVNFNFEIADGSVSLGSVQAQLDIGGMALDAALTFADKNDLTRLTADDKKEFIDIGDKLNALASLSDLFSAPSLKFDVAYQTEDLQLTGNVVLDLNNIAAAGEIRVAFGGNDQGVKNLSFGYVDETAYLVLGSEGQKPVKFKAGLSDITALIRGLTGNMSESGENTASGLSLSELLYRILADQQVADLITLKEGMKIELDGTALLAMFGIDAELGTLAVTFEDGAVSLYCAGFEAVLTAGEAFEVDRSQYIEADDVCDLGPIMEKAKEIFADGGVTLSGTLALNSGISIVIEELSVSWQNGTRFYLSATLVTGDDTGKSLYASFDGTEIKFDYDGLKVSLAADEIQTFVQSVWKIFESLSLSVPNMPSVDGVEDLIAAFTGTNSGLFDMLAMIEIGASEDGLLYVAFGDYRIDVKWEEDARTFTANLTSDQITARAELERFTAIKSMPVGNYLDAAELIPLLNGISDVLENQAVSLTGMLSLEAENAWITLNVKKGLVDWSNGLSLYLYAGLAVNGVEQDIYISYSGNEKLIKFAYGGTGAAISLAKTQGSDLEILERALVQVYERIRTVVDDMVAENPMPQIDSLNGLLDLIGFGDAASSTVEMLQAMVGVEGSDIASILNALKFGVSQEGNLTLTFGGLEAELIRETDQDGLLGLVATLTWKDLGISLNDCHVTYADAGLSMPDVNYLTAEDFAELLDYLGATAELLTEQSLSVDVKGKLFAYGDGDRYASSGYVKYDITANLTYEQGTSGFPVHINAGSVNTETGRREGMNFYIAPDFYLHLNISLLAKNAADDSMIVDLYLLDANPDTANGTTTGTYTKDGALDVYFTLSNKSQGGDPLKIYAPLDEIMTFVAMGGAMLELDTLTSSNDGVAAVISELGNVFEQLLFDYYLPHTKDQFASLGSSLIRQFIPGGLQSLLDQLVGAMGGSSADHATEIIGKEAFIKSLDVSDGEFALVLDSTAVYGDASAFDLTFSASKEKIATTTEEGTEVTRTRITSAHIGNVYLDSNLTDMLNLDLAVSYGGVEKPEVLAGYLDFSEVDTLVKALVNSATHEDGVNANGNAKYVLNDNFYISGKIDMNVPVAEPLVTANVELTLNGMKISIDEINKILLDITFSYSKTTAKVLGFLPISVIDNDATVDLSIRDDMIYMRKTVPDSNVSYRILSLNEFSADIMNQITWLFSFSSTVQSIMNSVGTSGGSDPVDMSGYDYGALLSAYLKNYQYTVAQSSIAWNMVLNGSTIGSLAGITMSDIAVTLGAIENEGLYELSSLTASGSLFDAIDYSADLMYDNIHGRFAEGKSDQTTAIPDVEIAEGVTWAELLGGTAYDDIKENTYWDLMLLETGNTCLEYVDGGTVKVGWLTYEFSDLEGVTTEIGKGRFVLYNSSTGTVYSDLEYPSLDRFTAQDYTAVWKELTINSGDGLLVKHAGFDKTYTVTLSGDYWMEGYTWNEEKGVYEMQVSNVYQQLLIAKDVVVEGEDGYYALKGYTDSEGNSYEFRTKYDNDGNECFVVENIQSDLDLIAVWERVYQVRFYDADGFSCGVTYYYADTVLEENNLPSVPEQAGYTGYWVNENDESAIGQVISSDSNANYAFYASYRINSYTVRLTSQTEVTDEGFVYDAESGVWIKSEVYVYGTTLSLESLVPVTNTRIFEGWRDDAGNTMATVVVRDHATYSAAWINKTISVTRYSEVEFEGATGQDENGYYQTVILNGSNDYALQDVALNVDDAASYQFLGWWYEGAEGWQRIENVTSFVVDDVSRITVHALWIQIHVNGSGTRNLGWTGYTYAIECTASYVLYGNSELISNISLQNVNYRIYCNNAGSYQSANEAENILNVSYGSIQDKVTASKTQWTRYSHWNFVVSFVFEYRDGSNTYVLQTIEGSEAATYCSGQF